MSPISHLQRKRDALEREYDLLSEKIERLRADHAIEPGAAVRFQLEQQIEQAESERDAVERQIEALEEKLERQAPEEGALPEYVERSASAWLIYSLLAVAALVTLLELVGVLSKGLRFLGEFATNPGAVLGAVLALTALTGFASGYVLLMKQKDTHPWWRRPPAYGARDRVLARVVLIANVTVTLILVLGILRYDVVHAQPVVEGQLGVAVAQFGEGVEIEDSARGRELSAFVARNLRREIDLLPGLAGNVTIISAPLVKDEEEAQRVARENGVALVIWGWVLPGEDTFVPSFTFVEPPDVEVGWGEVPGWYEVEISGDGTLELSQTVARRTSGLIEYIVGLIYLDQDDYERAAVEFQRAIALTEEAQPGIVTDHEMRSLMRSLAIYHLVLGRTLAAQGKPDQARAEYESAQECDPEYGPTYVGFGNIDYSERRCQQALQWYEKAVELVPRTKKAAAFYARGNAYFCLEQYEAAAADYRLAIENAAPDDRSLALYHLVLGIILCRLNRSSEGIEHISQAQRLAGSDSSLQEAALKEVENCRPGPTAISPSPTPALSPTAVLSLTPPPPAPASAPSTTLFPTAVLSSTPTSTPTLFPTRLPTATPSPTPFPTPLPHEPPSFPTQPKPP